MKAITLHQPWATLVAEGKKVYETRSWPPKYRGTIAIHAGKEQRWVRELVRPKHHKDFPLGVIVAVATLSDCITTEEAQVSNAERMHGDFGPDRFAWKLGHVFQLPKPVPCRGHQMIWNLPDEIGNPLAIDYANWLTGQNLRRCKIS